MTHKNKAYFILLQKRQSRKILKSRELILGQVVAVLKEGSLEGLRRHFCETIMQLRRHFVLIQCGPKVRYNRAMCSKILLGVALKVPRDVVADESTEIVGRNGDSD